MLIMDVNRHSRVINTTNGVCVGMKYKSAHSKKSLSFTSITIDVLRRRYVKKKKAQEPGRSVTGGSIREEQKLWQSNHVVFV